jgi:hypothetical protein
MLSNIHTEEKQKHNIQIDTSEPCWKTNRTKELFSFTTNKRKEVMIYENIDYNMNGM